MVQSSIKKEQVILKQYRLLFIGLIAGILIANVGTSYGAAALEKVSATIRPDIKVKVDGKASTLKNSPIQYKGVTYLPVRDVAGLFGYSVGIDDKTQTIGLTKGVTQLKKSEKSHASFKLNSIEYNTTKPDSSLPAVEKYITVSFSVKIDKAPYTGNWISIDFLDVLNLSDGMVYATEFTVPASDIIINQWSTVTVYAPLKTSVSLTSISLKDPITGIKTVINAK